MFELTLSWRRPIRYRNQSIDLLCKSMDWCLYDDGLRHERVKTAREKTQYSSKSFFRLTHFQKHSLEVFYKKIVLKNFAKVYKIHRKHLYRSLFLINLPAYMSRGFSNLLKKRLRQKWILLNFSWPLFHKATPVDYFCNK